MTNGRHRIQWIAVSMACAGLAATPEAPAEDFVWIGPSGGRWADGANWNFGEAPQPADRAILPVMGGSYSVIVDGQRSINQLLIESSDATLRIVGDSAVGNASLTVANGFSTPGRIELSSTAARSATLTVSAGTLRIEAGGQLHVLAGSGGARTLSLQLDNQGLLRTETAVTLSKSSADHVSNGTVEVAGGILTVNQSGSTPTFSNSGTVTVSAGSMFDVSGGVLNQSAGSIDGPGTLRIRNATANFTTAFSNATTELLVDGATLNGPGTLTNTREFTCPNTRINAPFANAGDLLILGQSSFAGATGDFTLDAGRTMRIGSPQQSGNFDAEGDFTNHGLIELSGSVAYFSAWNTLTNTADGTIRVLPGGSRRLNGSLINHGQIELMDECEMNHQDADGANYGTISFAGGDYEIYLNDRTFSNYGDIIVPTGHTLTFRQGTFNQLAGSITGTGTLELIVVSATFNTDFDTADTGLRLSSVQLAGSATLFNSTTLAARNSNFELRVINDGLLISDRNCSFEGPGNFVQSPGATLRIDCREFASTTTFADGFTNYGLVELLDSINPNSVRSANLHVDGPFVNAPGATIRMAELGGQVYGLLTNQGMLAVERDGTLRSPGSGGGQTNNGSIVVSGGDLVLDMEGDFVSTGSIQIAAGASIAVYGGDFFQSAGSIDGPGQLVIGSAQVYFIPPGPTGGMSFSFTDCTVSGAAFTNTGSMTLDDTIVYGPISNQSLLTVRGSCSILAPQGDFVQSPSATLRIEGRSNPAIFQVPNNFQNHGRIELTASNGAGDARLRMLNGTFYNEPSGVVRAMRGAGGERMIQNAFVNNGRIEIEPGATLRATLGYRQNSTGAISPELAGRTPSTIGRLIVTGLTELEGMLEPRLVQGFAPAAGDAFAVVSILAMIESLGCEAIGGDPLPPGLRYHLRRDPAALSLRVVDTPPLPGDNRCDCDVDLQDLAALLANFGQTSGPIDAGDLDGDSDVDLADLAQLLANFGVSCQ